MNLENIALVLGIGAGVFNLFILLIGVGIQYGMYTSFKNKVELDMAEYKTELNLLKDVVAKQDVNQGKLMTKVEGIENKIDENFERIFNKLETNDATFRDLIKELGSNKK